MLPAWLAMLGCGEPDVVPLDTLSDDAEQPVVAPGLTVVLRGAPESLAIGATAILVVEVRSGDQVRDDATFRFTSSHPGIVAVDPSGVLTGRAAGTAWVTVESEGGAAMVEISVP